MGAPLFILVCLACAAVAFELSNSRTFQFFGELVHRVDTSEKVVALTFDDAPSKYSQEVLDLLARKNVKATFYMIGESMEAYPEEAKAIVTQGHEMGNHSYSHERFLLKSPTFIRHEIEKTNALIHELGYKGEITFRPPYGKKLVGLPRYLSQQGIKTIMWDVEPDTDHAGDVLGMTAYVLERTKPGSIILLHPFCEEACIADREALPVIIDNLKAQGFTFVTVSELLTRRAVSH